MNQPPPPGKTPRCRRLRALFIGAGLVALLFAAAFGVAEYTSRSTFCEGCHEMGPYYATWLASAHRDAECVDCHIPPGVISFIETKLFSFREIWVHLAQHMGAHPESPLAVTRDIPDANCGKCHDTPAEADIGTSAVSFSHSLHAEMSCLDCHARLVHRGVASLSYRDPAGMSFCLACHDRAVAPGQCSSFHSAPHRSRGECSSCYGLESWTDAGATHPFPRQGAHAGLDCADCHGASFKQVSTSCVSCHGARHGGLTQCASCRTTKAWKPSTFRHRRVGEHIPSGEHGLSCSRCHKSGFATATCTPCHSGRPGQGDD